MVGQHGDAARRGADQFAQPAFQLNRRQAVETQHQDALRRHPPNAHQVRHAVDDRPRLARSRPGQDQRVFVLGAGHDRLLHRVPQIVHDPAIGFLANRARDQILTVAEETLDELGARQLEIGQDQLQPFLDRLQAAPRVFDHHVDLQDLFLVVLVQRDKVALGIAAALGVGLQADGHRLAKHRQPVLQDDHLLFVQVHQAALDGGQRVFDLIPQRQIRLDGTRQVLQGELNQPVAGRRRIGGDLVQDRAAARPPPRPGVSRRSRPATPSRAAA